MPQFGKAVKYFPETALVDLQFPGGKAVIPETAPFIKQYKVITKKRLIPQSWINSLHSLHKTIVNVRNSTEKLETLE